MKRIAANLALGSVALALSLGVGEAAMRAVVALPLERRLPEVKYASHDVRRFTLRPNQRAFTYGATATIDERGFRANGEGSQAVDGPTILALGDSFTFGLGVDDRETWPALVEQRMRASGGAVNVLNAGTISYGVFQQLDLLKATLVELRPTIVIHGLYWNDYMNPQPPKATDPAVVTAEGYFVWDQPQEVDTAAQQARAALNRSALFYSLKQVVAQTRRGGSTSAYSVDYVRMLQHGVTETDWIPIEAFYRELRALGDNHGFSTLVVIMPVNDLVRDGSSASHAYPTAARQRLDALGIPYLDAFELWDKGAFGDAPFLPQGADAHLNTKGYEILADAIVERLATLTPARATR